MNSSSTIPDIKELVKVGHVSDGHGLRGDVYILVYSGDADWSEDIEEIFLGPAGSNNSLKFKAFTIKKTKLFKKGFIAQLDSVTDRTQADALKKLEVWIPAETFVSEDGDQPYLSEFLNFSVEDQQLGVVGKIENFSFNGSQDLMILDKKVNGQNIEIPFVDQFVIEIDYDAQKIMMDLPEGLISINEKD